MGSKGDGVNDKQPCEYKHECPLAGRVCSEEQCGFYFRVKAEFSIEETREELRWCGIDEDQIRSLSHILDSAEFRKQALFRYYRSCDNQ
jgi:hypothetical protein